MQQPDLPRLIAPEAADDAPASVEPLLRLLASIAQRLATREAVEYEQQPQDRAA